MSLNHAVIWIDHQEAHVIQFNESASESEIIRTKSKHAHLHHKAGTNGSGHAATDKTYLHAVTEAVAEAAEIFSLVYLRSDCISSSASNLIFASLPLYV